jgi:hypothetical protein
VCDAAGWTLPVVRSEAMVDCVVRHALLDSVASMPPWWCSVAACAVTARVTLLCVSVPMLISSSTYQKQAKLRCVDVRWKSTPGLMACAWTLSACKAVLLLIARPAVAAADEFEVLARVDPTHSKPA